MGAKAYVLIEAEVVAIEAMTGSSDSIALAGTLYSTGNGERVMQDISSIQALKDTLACGTTRVADGGWRQAPSPAGL